MKIQRPVEVISILLALGLASPTQAEDRAGAAQTGFYGGVSLRDGAVDSGGLTFGTANSAWNRFGSPTADDTSARALVFGGYRWHGDLAVEASFNAIDKYALRPAGTTGRPTGVGLSFGSAPGLGEPQARSWNLDVFTSWNFYRAFALYGRMGYAQTETVPALGGGTSVTPDSRRLRDGVNYGLGLRYDMSSSLGLRLEYGRFGRFAGEVGNGLPDTDQVSFGVQLRF
jgi:opacity protein-like surface antigen